MAQGQIREPPRPPGSALGPDGTCSLIFINNGVTFVVRAPGARSYAEHLRALFDSIPADSPVTQLLLF